MAGHESTSILFLYYWHKDQRQSVGAGKMNPWEEWRRQQEEKLRQQSRPPDPKQSKEPPPRRLVTEEELARLKQLHYVRKAWWCGDSRFIEQFEDATKETQITERQAWYIKVLWFKYRRQLGNEGKKPVGYK